LHEIVHCDTVNFEEVIENQACFLRRTSMAEWSAPRRLLAARALSE